jgi:hypothetical protein
MSSIRHGRLARSNAARGPGALTAAQGAQKVRRKMAEAVDLAKLHGTDEIDRALGTCVDAGRFADGDLASILVYQRPAAAS